MYFTVAEAAREACLRVDELLTAIEEEELEATEGPEGETLIDGNDLVEFVQSRRAETQEEDEDE